jgi:hypothetical protein
MFIGVPIAIWLSYRLGDALEKGQLDKIVIVTIYVYVFLLSILLFRALFSYSRWIFPKVELQSDLASSPLRHRLVWTAICVPIVVALLYDAIKLLF